jgi:hypothetical protein
VSVDSDILARLDVSPLHLYDPAVAATPNAVFDGHVEADEKLKVIAVPLPFVQYFGKRSEPVNRRAGGRADRGHYASLVCVGRTREQADWIADRVEAALDHKPVGASIAALFERDLPERDRNYTRPDSGPLFRVGLTFTV